MGKRDDLRKERARLQREQKKVKAKASSLVSTSVTPVIVTDNSKRWRHRWPLLASIGTSVAMLGTLLAYPSMIVAIFPFVQSNVEFTNANYLLDAANPFTARFDVVNHNTLFDMRKVEVMCFLEDLELSQPRFGVQNIGIESSTRNRFARIPPNQRATTVCAFNSAFSARPSGHNTPDVANIVFAIQYDWLWEKQKREYYQLVGEHDSQNIMHWSFQPFVGDRSFLDKRPRFLVP